MPNLRISRFKTLSAVVMSSSPFGWRALHVPMVLSVVMNQMKQPQIVLRIFVSGKIVLTGAKVRDEIYAAFENIYPVLTEFRKNQQ
ncbi:unnamed protein product [Trifolium pratense]|uniref:Uncharacterized protein n=1 Tax=Trifolium pratense TaxID=57577 RepID=A0ACB0KNX2_TRIPR|nr:unnamed protein product [Trifolium pratense]